MRSYNYVLSPHFQILEKNEIAQLDWVTHAIAEGKLETPPQHLLYNKNEDTCYLINPVIETFLQAFKEPTMLPLVGERLAKEVGCDIEELKATMIDFMDEMCSRKIVVKEKKANQLKNNPKEIQFFQVGELLGNFQLTQLIFKNLKIEIWKATHLENGQTVALKLKRLKEGISKKKRKRKEKGFFQEFQLMEEIQEHPLICKTFGTIKSEKYMGGVLEFIDGGSLTRFLRNNTLTVSEKLGVLSQIIEAMAFLHQKGIVHGDLHSGNFLIKDDHSLKLIDFNFSNHSQPHDGEIIRQGGIHHYLPPEKISSNVFHLVDHRADFRSEVFQIGVIVYILFFEKFPFTALTFKELVVAIQQHIPEFPNPNPKGETLPGALIYFLKKSLNKQPEQRFASALEMKEFCEAQFDLAKKQEIHVS